MFAVTGYNTTIVKELQAICGEPCQRISAPAFPGPFVEPFQVPDVPRYVLAAGILPGKSIDRVSQNEATECCLVNLVNVIRLCEQILERDNAARICVIGSMSVELGSFDKLYAATKAGVHQYVLSRVTEPTQQLVCVAPTIIIDSGMTHRRPNLEGLEDRRHTVRAVDVARTVFDVLWSATPKPCHRNTIVHVAQRRNP